MITLRTLDMLLNYTFTYMMMIYLILSIFFIIAYNTEYREHLPLSAMF